MSKEIVVELQPNKLFKFEFTVLKYRIKDGDTIWLDLDQGFNNSIKQSIRLYGIDTPESSTAAGKLVTQVIVLWMKRHPILTAQSIEKDKYEGRFVGHLRPFNPTGGSQTISDYLIEKGLAKKYLGGHKDEWTKVDLLGVLEKAQVLIESYKNQMSNEEWAELAT